MVFTASDSSVMQEVWDVWHKKGAVQRTYLVTGVRLTNTVITLDTGNECFTPICDNFSQMQQRKGFG
jgi:hypothetical protein